jgi:hypothetical protein
MAPAKKVVKQADVDVELGDIYEAPNVSTALDDGGLLPVTPEDQEILTKFYADFDYVMVFPMMGEGQIPFNPKDPSSSEQVSVISRSTGSVAVYAVCTPPYSYIYAILTTPLRPSAHH